MNETIQTTIRALKQNNMNVLYCDTKEEIWGLIAPLLRPGARLASGGSVTLQQCGVIEQIKNGPYTYLDRGLPQQSREEKEARMRAPFSCDTYLMSSNAVTMTGELINVDGFGNRVASLCFGPEKVIVVVGANKIVPDVTAGIRRIRTVAAPLNCRRLNKNTYCAKTGHCVALDGDNEAIGQGCAGERICSQTLISAYQMQKDRITVIVCGEDLGY